MTVEQTILTQNATNPNQWDIVDRVQLSCEVVEVVDARRTRVRILEAGAGLSVNDEIVVPTAKITA